ncbi:ribosomal protein L22 [Hypoxylon sp. NC1633]|nr:ribosomal protein L22 [Hypoxylon sp. NC1633]
MSLHLPLRRVASAARATAGKPSLHLQYLLPRTQRRNAWFDWGRRKGQQSTADAVNSPLERELTRRDREMMMAEKNMDRTQGSSIFDDEIKDPERATRQAKDEKEDRRGTRQVWAASRVKEHMERAENPDPRWRMRFLRKKVMQMVRAESGTETTHQSRKAARDLRVRQAEKQHTSKSESLPTSTKKLVFLSHQIVGKTVDEAITQMRFSKKKMAREVKWQLEEARDRAIAAHGMGLGAVNKDGETAVADPKKIQTKDGRWVEVRDPTALYVDQSWVTRGSRRGFRYQYHSRGRMSVMMRPTAGISVVLKEEKTRIRQHDDRVAAQEKKAPWVHLPNRPVTAQRQYYSW